VDGERVGAISCQRLQDRIGGLGPDEWLWVVVVGLDEGGDGGLQFLDAAMCLLRSFLYRRSDLKRSRVKRPLKYPSLRRIALTLASHIPAASKNPFAWIS
jgi:hypothetical protein